MAKEIIVEWDEAKRQSTLNERGLDFADAIYIINDPSRVERIDDRHDYGEVRYIVYGLYRSEVICLCYTKRGEAYRIISMRRIHKKERRRYYGINES
ncbi:MAG: BrnT family toxin [Spirochaetaceae bacterium]|nr:BrnT family toxin [Spirochaetaceae bacterium]